MSNPYATPSAAQAYNSGPNPPSGAPPGQDGFVAQIPVIGVLTMVQAGMELLMSLVLFGIGGTMLFVQGNNMGNPPQPPEFFWLMAGIYGGMGSIAFVIGLMRMLAGYWVFHFRNRMFAIVANILGFGSFLTCYCGMTGLAIGIYSLIVLLQPSVVAAFAEKARAPAATPAKGFGH